MPAIVYRSPGAHSASWMSWPPRRIWYGMLYALIGVWPPRSSAAEAVITLAVEPGWNWACTARLVVWPTLVTFDGSYVGYCAMASTAPVCGWMITTVQLSALVFLTWLAQACSAAYCSAGTMVSRRLLPFTTGLSLLPASGICWPSVPICTCSLPDWPASSALSCSSRPAPPVRTPACGCR